VLSEHAKMGKERVVACLKILFRHSPRDKVSSSHDDGMRAKRRLATNGTS